MSLEKLYNYFERELPEILRKLPLGEKKYIGIYGIGMHTERLLYRYQRDVGLIYANLIFIDSDKKSLTEKYNDCDVYNVKDIGELRLDAVILSSPLYEEEMYQTLQTLYGNKFCIYRFYDTNEKDIFQRDGIYFEKDKPNKRLKVKFVDFWPSFDYIKHPFTRLLVEQQYRIEISDIPDLLICGEFGCSYKNYKNCKKILLIAEPNRTSDFNMYDYAIGYRYFNSNKYFRYNFYEPHESAYIQNRDKFADYSLAKRKFCNFIYSNEIMGEGAFLRKQFCMKLMEYKHVDCPGKVLNNMKNVIEPGGSSCWGESKYNFIKQYKFTIAFENYMLDGYTTEKLWQPLVAGSIPIYWGNPRICEDICTEAIINCNEYDNDFDAIIQRIKEIDEDDEYYMYMLQKSPLRNAKAFDSHKSQLKVFLGKVIGN